MKQIRILFFIGVLHVPLLSSAWGFFGHKLINRVAVFTLPPEMFGFYKHHLDYLTEHAVDPDKRRYSDSSEACRHYIDLDYYEHNVPIDTVPVFWKDAVLKYSEDTLRAYGIVPWHVQVMMFRLTDAFQSGDETKILKYSAEIGHYIADACVPLHATMNYNGQMTGQTGIHGFWESRLPELFSKSYDFFTGRASYIDLPQQEIWKACTGSFAAKDSVLGFEKSLSASFPADQKFTFVQKGNTQVKNYSEAYAAAYNRLLSGMVERRMRLSIQLVGALWYTAWVNAGQPVLSYKETGRSDKQLKKETEESATEFMKQMLGRPE